MQITTQLSEAIWYGPLSITKLTRRSFAWLMLYLLAALFIFSVIGWMLNENEMAIKQLILNYLFPSNWHELSEKLGNFLIDSQAKTVIANAIISGALVIASVFLFPLKEQYSAVFEKEAKLSIERPPEFPLMLQAWEEIKLIIIYLTSQSLILWIGYYPFAWTTWLSIILSYLFLFFTFGLDFIAPTLQRHRVKYSLMIKVLIRNPLLPTLFGVLFCLPVILLSLWITKFEDLSIIDITTTLFLFNIIFLTLAVPTGTSLAISLLPSVRKTIAPTVKTKRVTFATFIVILGFTGVLHSQLIKSLHHKSQLLKANYSVDWRSFDYNLPSIDAFFNKEANTELSFDVEIRNPTEFDIVIENSIIFVEKEKETIATLDLTGFEIPSGESRKVKMKIDALSNLGKISDFRTLLEGWRVDMHLEVWPGIPFIINISE